MNFNSKTISSRFIYKLGKIFIPFFILTTVIQILINIYYTKKDIITDMKHEYKIFAPSLNYEMWTLNIKSIEQTVQGILNQKSISGISIKDSKGKVIVEKFLSDNNDFSYTSDLIYKSFNTDYSLGTVTIYSNMNVIYERLETNWIVMIISSLIKLLFLIVLMLILFNLIVRKPLLELVKIIYNTNIKDIENSHILISDNDSDELEKLKYSFNSVSSGLAKSQKELRELNETLEQKVRARTHELEMTKNELERQVIIDPMTDLYNRRFFNKEIERMIKEAKRENTYISFAMFDVDHFKQYNDTYGHQKGDDALISIAEVLKKSLKRPNDYIFRLGGEEFGVLFKGLLPKEAELFIESIRANIEKKQIEHSKNSASKYLTASFGLITIKIEEQTSSATIYKDADILLYEAKEAGRNKIKTNF